MPVLPESLGVSPPDCFLLKRPFIFGAALPLEGLGGALEPSVGAEGFHSLAILDMPPCLLRMLSEVAALQRFHSFCI